MAPELWSNSLKDALDKGVEEKRLRYAGKALVDGGEEGFWIPAYLVKQYPEMKTIEGVKKHAKLFSHPEDKAKSAFYSCPAGWNCQISAGNLFKAMNLADAGFDIIDQVQVPVCLAQLQKPTSVKKRGSVTTGHLLRFLVNTTW